MTSKEVLRELVLKYNIPQHLLEPLRLLDKRDTPMEVIKTQDWYYHCPRCEDEVDVSNASYDSKQIYRYCYHCGQRLDWSNE